MSTAETVRPEQQHTPEPWHLTTGGMGVTDGICAPEKGYPNGRQIAVTYLGRTLAERQANARRIVACVNMLAGIPTADLLRQPTVAQSVRPIGELVDAATEALDLVECVEVESLRLKGTKTLARRLRAAIAALKEGK